MRVSLEVQLDRKLEPVVPWEDIACILWHGDILFITITSNYQTSTACNGKISMWDKELRALGEFQAHEYGIYHMCAGANDTIYSCASDSSICHWKCCSKNSPDSSQRTVNCQRLSVLKGHLEPPWKLQYISKRNLLFSADGLGEIRQWEGDEYKGVLETYEEVWDMVVLPSCILTVRNLDVTITTIPDDGIKKACSVKNTVPGAGPLYVSGDRLVCLHRTKFELLVYSLSEAGNPLIKAMEGHNALVTGFVGSEKVLFSGDYEGRILAWDLQNLRKVTEIRLSSNGCVNALAYDAVENAVYVAQENKVLTKLSVQLSY